MLIAAFSIAMKIMFDGFDFDADDGDESKSHPGGATL